MSDIILITGTFPTYDRFGIKNGEEFVTSHGVAADGTTVIVQNEHPRQLGGVYDAEIGEWVLRCPKD